MIVIARYCCLCETRDAVRSGDLELLGARAVEYIAAAKAANTVRAYRSDWRVSAWAGWRGLEALPATPETLALYLTDLAGAAKRACGHPEVTRRRRSRRSAGRAGASWLALPERSFSTM